MNAPASAVLAPSLKLEELLRHTENESRRWFQWLARNPAAFDVKTDIAQAKSVRELVQHIVAVDLRYAERLHSQAVTPYEAIGTDREALAATARQAFAMLHAFLERAGAADWRKTYEFPTRSMGTLTGSGKKIFIHTLLHGMRHWAQAAVVLRAAGFRQDWQHDFLFTDVME